MSKTRLEAFKDRKVKGSLAMYVAAILLAFVRPWVAKALYAAVAMMWLVPDRRIESRLGHRANAV